jgi:hypothetical protein
MLSIACVVKVQLLLPEIVPAVKVYAAAADGVGAAKSPTIITSEVERDPEGVKVACT